MGGILVIGLAILIANQGNGLRRVLTASALAPYYILIVSVLLQKLLVSPLTKVGLAPVISSGQVTFTLLTSPSAALLVANFMAIFILRTQATPTA